jgi:hypothetical protein
MEGRADDVDSAEREVGFHFQGLSLTQTPLLRYSLVALVPLALEPEQATQLNQAFT